MRKVDSLERSASTASKGQQQYEAQLQGLERQVREAQAAKRVAEGDFQKACLCKRACRCARWYA